MDWLLYYSQYGVAIVAFYAVYYFGIKAQQYQQDIHLGLLARAEYFSRGIFLGIALFHLLPEGYSDLLPFLGSHTLSTLLSLSLFALLFMWFCEQGITHIAYIREKNSAHWLAYWILFLLVLHASIEGCALGLSENSEHFFALALAILVHKGSEGFALSIVLGRYHFSTRTRRYLLILLASATPLGIILCGNLQFIVQHQHFNLIEGYFNSIAAGTFLYIAIGHAMTGCEHSHHAKAYQRWVYYGLGLGLICVVGLLR
jgi:zinc transporter ZupT